MGTSKKYSSTKTKTTDICDTVGILLFFISFAVVAFVVGYIFVEFFEALIRL